MRCCQASAPCSAPAAAGAEQRCVAKLTCRHGGGALLLALPATGAGLALGRCLLCHCAVGGGVHVCVCACVWGVGAVRELVRVRCVAVCGIACPPRPPHAQPAAPQPTRAAHPHRHTRTLLHTRTHPPTHPPTHRHTHTHTLAHTLGGSGGGGVKRHSGASGCAQATDPAAIHWQSGITARVLG